MLLWVIISLSAWPGSAEIIAPERRVVWQDNVGIPGGIPDSSPKAVYATVPVGASVDTVSHALHAAAPNQVVVMPAGNYSWNGQLDWAGVDDGVVLRGAGSGKTVVTWQFYSECGMNMRAAASEHALSVDADLSADGHKGDTVINVNAVPSWVTVGNLIGIDELDDTNYVAGVGTNGGESYREMEGNGPRGKGQLVRVIAKTDTNITLELPLYSDFRVSQSAQIFQPAFDPSAVKPLTLCGVEGITFRATFSEQDGHVFKMQLCDRCYLKDVEIDNMPGGAGVWSAFSYRCQFFGCYIHDSHQLGGGQGYGISPYHISCGFLIENCIFRKLHNAMSVNYGSSGNVFAYNYEAEGQSDAHQNPSMNTHGVHTYMNLWEGNVCDDKLLADWTHGSSSHNTVFRCRITGINGSSDGKTCASVEYYNRYWNLVGNVLGTAGIQDKYVVDNASPSSGHGNILKMGGVVNVNLDFNPSDDFSYTNGMYVLVHGNYDPVNNTVLWEPLVSDHNLPDSLYLSSKPAWFGNFNWPPVEPFSPSTAIASNLPAGDRYFRLSSATNQPSDPLGDLVFVFPTNNASLTRIVGISGNYHGVSTDASNRNYSVNISQDDSGKFKLLCSMDGLLGKIGNTEISGIGFVRTIRGQPLLRLRGNLAGTLDGEGLRAGGSFVAPAQLVDFGTGSSGLMATGSYSAKLGLTPFLGRKRAVEIPLVVGAATNLQDSWTFAMNLHRRMVGKRERTFASGRLTLPSGDTIQFPERSAHYTKSGYTLSFFGGTNITANPPVRNRRAVIGIKRMGLAQDEGGWTATNGVIAYRFYGQAGSGSVLSFLTTTSVTNAP